MKKNKPQKPTPMYKHSYGHYWTDVEAHAVMKILQKEKPKLKFQVVREYRSNNTWKKYCVCVMVPSKQEKTGSKKVKRGSK